MNLEVSGSLYQGSICASKELLGSKGPKVSIMIREGRHCWDINWVVTCPPYFWCTDRLNLEWLGIRGLQCSRFGLWRFIVCYGEVMAVMTILIFQNRTFHYQTMHWLQCRRDGAETARAIDSESEGEAVSKCWSSLSIVCTVFISWRSWCNSSISWFAITSINKEMK